MIIETLRANLTKPETYEKAWLKSQKPRHKSLEPWKLNQDYGVKQIQWRSEAKNFWNVI